MSEFVFAVDLDGVCAQHTEAFRPIVAKETGVAESDLPLVRDWNFAAWGLSEDEFELLHSKAVKDYRMFLHMDVMEGCAEALWRLSDAGVRIRIVTHRLYSNWGHQVTVSDTVEWLDKNQIPYRDICFLANKSTVDANAYVEDAPHNVEQLRQAGAHVIVYDQPYNQQMEGPRAYNWIEVEAQVVDLLVAHAGAAEVTLPGIDAGPDLAARKSAAQST